MTNNTKIKIYDKIIIEKFIKGRKKMHIIKVKNILNKIKILTIIFISMLFAFNLKSIANEEETQKSYTKEQMAIREIANAYYNKGINGQYCSYKNSRYYPPEEATSQSTLYSVCSVYTFQIYYQAFGIKQPTNTHKLITYANKYYDADNIEQNDIVEYWEKTTGENNETIYQDNKGNIKDINLQTEQGREEYATKLLKEYDLQVGDIICYHTGVQNSNQGHALLVYDIIYDDNGEPIDALIRESTSRYETKTTKITKGLSYADVLNENTNIHEGTFKEMYLANSYKTSSSVTRNSLIYNARNMTYFTILRPLLKDENGDYTGKYYYATFESQSGTKPTGFICTGRTLTDYSMTDVTESRLNYSKIDIEKTVDGFNKNVVNLGDELEYTIKITNNSDTKYNSFKVIEKIPEYTEISNSGNGEIAENELTWNIESLEPNQSIEIKYKVRVKNEITSLGKEIVSTGTVAGIPSSTVTNYISTNLKENEKSIIRNNAQTIINSKEEVGEKLISEVYNKSFGIDLNLNNLDITDLIKTRNGTTYYPEDNENVPTIYLNKENNFSNMVVSNYYGGLYTTSSSIVYLKSWENPEYLGSRDKRADTIYKENFQTGDILVYKNTQTANENVTYETEDGTYYLIYIDQNDKITVDDNEIYGFIGIDENGNLKNIKDDYTNLQTLLGKDYYAVLRPSMTLDINPMELKVEYSETRETNQDVTVTITANEEMLEVAGWTLSEDKKTLTKTYSENTVENVKIYDYSGNEINEEIKIENIDKVNPTINIKYSTTELTKEDVTVTIEANENIKEIEGWQLSEDGKTLSKIYTKNEEETITIYDIAGNSIVETIKIENIDKEKPEYEIEYSTTLSTNQDVQVTITTNEEVQELNGWELSEDKKTLTKIYEENTEEEITIKDIAGNESIITTIRINNIDKVNPTIKIEYSTTEKTDKDVVITITSDEVIKGINGWTLSEDMKQLSREYRENTKEDIIITDQAGNTTIAKIEISNIEKTKIEENENENTNTNTNTNSDTTVTEKVLPKAGKVNIIIAIITIAIISTILYIKLKKYKDIK